MLQNKDTRLHIRTSSEQVKRIIRVSEILDTPQSEFVRKAIDEKLEKLARRYPELQRQIQTV